MFRMEDAMDEVRFIAPERAPSFSCAVRLSLADAGREETGDLSDVGDAVEGSGARTPSLTGRPCKDAVGSLANALPFSRARR